MKYLLYILVTGLFAYLGFKYPSNNWARGFRAGYIGAVILYCMD